MGKSVNVKNFFRILGPIIFVYILSQINYGLFLSELKIIKWPYLALTMLLLIACILLKSLRWKTVLSALKIDVSRSEAINLYWLGLFVGMITPGRVGELIKVYFLKFKGYNFFRSFFSVIFDRLSDVAVVLGLGFIVSWYYFNAISGYIGLFGAVIALFVILFFVLSASKSGLHQLLSKIFAKIFMIDKSEYDRFTFDRLWQGIKSLKKADVAMFIFYMVLGWLAYFYARYAVAQALDLPLTLNAVIITSVLIAIVSALPISVAGLGTREAAVIYAFSLFGLDKEIALLFSLIIFSCDSLVTSIGLAPYLQQSYLIDKVKAGGIDEMKISETEKIS